MRQSHMQHFSQWDDQFDEVVGEGRCFRVVNDEIKVGVACDDVWSSSAQISQQKDVVKPSHCLAPYQTGNRPDLVDQNRMKLLPVQTVERLERTHYHIV